MPKIRRWVVCGLSETIATFRPTSALTRVDLPTFGRPATATNPLLTAERGSRGDLEQRQREQRAEERAVRDLERGVNAGLDAGLRDEKSHHERQERDQELV